MPDKTAPHPPVRKKPTRCPICGKPPVAPHRPFCSARCAQVDLGRWLGGGYAIPGESARRPGEEDEESPD